MSDKNPDLEDSIEGEIKQSWLKLSADSKKAGFRDGIADGRQSNFQSAFDWGYREGFKNGFLIGKQKGILQAKSEMNGHKKELLRYSKRGWCQICSNEEIMEKTINEIVKHQEMHLEDTMQNLLMN